MMTDTIADMLTRIRNSQRARHGSVLVPYSQLKRNIADLLSAEGYVGSVEKTEDAKPQLKIALRYPGGKPAIQEIMRMSKPGHRMYRKADEMPVVLNGFGLAIVSTPKGLMTSSEAKKKGLGGEIICSVH